MHRLATVAELLVTGRSSGLPRERRTQRMIDFLSDHVIVCGSGRVGRRDAGADLLGAIGRSDALEARERRLRVASPGAASRP